MRMPQVTVQYIQIPHLTFLLSDSNYNKYILNFLWSSGSEFQTPCISTSIASDNFSHETFAWTTFFQIFCFDEKKTSILFSNNTMRILVTVFSSEVFITV